MSETLPSEVQHKLELLYMEAYEQGRYFDALHHAITAYLSVYLVQPDTRIGPENKNAVTVDFIRSASEAIASAHAKTTLKSLKNKAQSREEKFECSFCGKTEPDVRLTSGGSKTSGIVFICNECSAAVAAVFKQQEDKN